MFASSYINEKSLTISDDNSSHVCFVPWGFVEHPKTNGDFLRISDNEKSLEKINAAIFEKLKNSNEKIFLGTYLTESALDHCHKHPLWFSESDKVWLTITYAELLRKQGILGKATENLLSAKTDIDQMQNIFPCTNVVFPNFERNCNSILINAANSYIQLGLPQKCINILNDIHIQNCDIIDSYHEICCKNLTSCALACQGSFDEALHFAESCIAKSPLINKHSIMAILYNQYGVLLAANREYESAILHFDKAIEIIDETTGSNSINSLTTKYNKFLVSSVQCKHLNAIKIDQLLSKLHNMLPENHIFQKIFTQSSISAEFHQLLDTGYSQEQESQFLWEFSFVTILDHPFSWIDYPPIDKSVVIGADYQVWAHLDQLLHFHPLRYSWISSIFLGSFHKLSNLHDKLMKRYGKFHLEKHAVAFLDSPSASKVQYLTSMKDFDTSNQFFTMMW